MLALLLGLTAVAGAQVARWDCAVPGAIGSWLGESGGERLAWVVLAAPARTGVPALDRVARAAVLRAYVCAPDLTDVQVSVYPTGTREYLQTLFAADPLMTLSVPRARLRAWLALPLGGWGGYDRVWYARTAVPIPEVPSLPNARGADWPPLAELAAITLGGARAGVLVRGAPWSNRAALTFDDGPHPLFTPLLLAALRRAGVRATFFVIGRNARAYPYLVRDALAQGVEIENHSYAHRRPRGLSAPDQWADLMRGQTLLTRLTGRRPRYFRPPGGGVTPTLLAQARSARVTLALWSDDPADYQTHGAAQLMKRLTRHLTRGAVLLLHDNASGALGAVWPLAREARARGLTLVPLSELQR